VPKSAHGAPTSVPAYTTPPHVSTDFHHDPPPPTMALDQTKVMDGNSVPVLSWYDNEWGFSNRMADTAVALAKTL
ncbi:glyceraldehyde-3-phosphate dehydrogenase, partial [Devosia chinhatensis]